MKWRYNKQEKFIYYSPLMVNQSTFNKSRNSCMFLIFQLLIFFDKLQKPITFDPSYEPLQESRVKGQLKVIARYYEMIL